jgi:hypothetical protein
MLLARGGTVSAQSVSEHLRHRPARTVDRPDGNRSLLTTCSYESPESTYGTCDGVPCGAKATVYDTQTEQEYCAKHFREVSRG